MTLIYAKQNLINDTVTTVMVNRSHALFTLFRNPIHSPHICFSFDLTSNKDL